MLLLLPVVFMAPSWVALIPSAVLHSSSSFSRSSPWLSPASWPGSKDWLRPLSLSLQFCPEELPTTGEVLHREGGHFVGVTGTVFWESEVLGVEVGGPSFLPKAACPLTTVVAGLLGTTLTSGPTAVLFELTGGWGLQSGGGLELQGEVGFVVGCGFLLMDVLTGTGGGDDPGAAWEGLGEEWWRCWGTPGMKAESLCGEAGGVWKLSPWVPKEKET